MPPILNFLRAAPRAFAVLSLSLLYPTLAHAADVTVYRDGSFAPGWQNWSWHCGANCAAPANEPNGALVNDLGQWGGVFLATSAVASITPTATLSFKMTPLSTTTNFLNVTLTRQDNYGGIFLSHAVPTAGLVPDSAGFISITIPMEVLNPSGLNFDGLQLQATSDWPARSLVRVNDVLVSGAPTVTPQAPTRAGASTTPTRATASATLQCAQTVPISPRIYGIAYADVTDFFAGANGSPAQWSIGATSRRWGGNPTSRYNPAISAWNTANDYFFENIRTNRTWQQYVADNAEHAVGSAVSIPTLGWVAKDASASGFPVGIYGAQNATDIYRPDAGNGRSPAGTNLTVTQPPTQTSVAFTPADAAAWVGALREAARAKGGRIDHYILDNEPDLWGDTHRDVRTTRLRAAELVENNKTFASAIRRAEPNAKIAGPATSGLFALRFSDYDNNNALWAGGAGSDRALVGGDMAPWYLRELKAHETATGIKLLDLFDTHYYPQGSGVYGGRLDLATSRLRVRSTRSLWDAGYVDESWYGQVGNPPVNLLPTLQGWIKDNYPGLGISIGEYSFGAEGHMSGAVAQAETLGRFGQAITVGGQRFPGVDSAYYWTYPAEKTPLYWAFKGFRNFDGEGRGFGDTSIDTRVLPALGSGDGSVSVFGSQDSASGEIIAAVINLSDDKTATTTLALADCNAMASATPYTYDGTTDGYVAATSSTVSDQQVSITSAPWSISFVRMTPVAAVPRAPANTVAPIVTGTAQVNATLSATAGKWLGEPAPTITYQWQRCDANNACVDIANATTPTQRLTTAEEGVAVRVVVTAANPLGTARVASAQSSVITADAPRASKPTRANTGVPAGITLTPYAGNTTIDIPNSVIEAVAITEPVFVTANNVTFKGSAITANNWALVVIADGVTGTRFEDVTITGGGGGFCILGSSLTVLRADISGCGNAIATAYDTRVEQSYLHNNSGAAIGGIYSAAISNITLRGNTIVAPAAASNAISISGDNVTRLNITGNWLDGGGYTVHIDATASVFSHNRFGRAAALGPKYPFTVNPLRGVGNVWDDNSEPVAGF